MAETPGEAGDVAGNVRVAGYFHPVVWSADGTVTALPGLGGGYAYAFDLDDAADVVGYAWTPTGDVHAVLWSSGTALDLNTALDASGAGWVLFYARAIASTGVIVGFGAHDGTAAGFVLTPAP